MSIIIDLVLLAILALCIWNGYSKGLILGIASIVVLIVAFVGANILAKTYSSEFMPMVEPFLGGIVERAVSKTEDTDEIKEVKDNPALSDDEKAYEVSVASLKSMGIIEKAANKLTDSIRGELNTRGKQLSATLTTKLSETLCFLIVFIIAFLLIVIVFTIIANVINLVFKLPGLDLVNDIGGIIMGIAKGFAFLFVIALVAQYVGFVFKKDDTLQKTIFLKWLMKINPLPKLFNL